MEKCSYTWHKLIELKHNWVEHGCNFCAYFDKIVLEK